MSGMMTTAANLMTRALRCFREGRVAEADALCAEALEQGGADIEALDLRAAIALRAGNDAAAADFIERAVALAPTASGLRYNLAGVQRKLGRLDEACEQYRQSLRLEPGAIGVLFELCLTLIDARRPLEARPLLKAVIAAAPHVPDAYFQLGTLQLEAGEHQDALTSYHRALYCQPDHLRARINAALMHRELERPGEAVLSTRIALLLDPSDGQLYNNLATLMRENGDESRYVDLLTRAVMLRPGNADFHYGLAMVETFRPGDSRLDALDALLARMPDDEVLPRASLHFALSKAYEDLGDLERSFGHQQTGNRLRRSTLSYDEARVVGGFERIAAAFTPEVIKADPGQGDPSEVPIFVLGMPRSGTTLVEQILASHPRVFGAGELPFLADAVNGHEPDPGLSFPENAASLGAEDYRIIGSRYVEALRRRAPGHDRIVDKQTENFRLVGVIHRALPKARIIHIRRNPVDTCLSIYSKLFLSDMPFAYDLAEIGRYWRGYDGLMAHWRSVLPEDAMLEIDYEALVADQEGQTRRLLDYCGLEWHEGCLSFHQNPRVVRTASWQQVRRPLYKSAVNRWRPPQDAIEPLMAGLSLSHHAAT